MAVSKAQQKAVKEYKERNYDRMEMLVPKGKKEIIKAAAVSVGESVNQFIIGAVDNRLNGSTSAPVLASVPAAAPTLSPAAVEHIKKTGESESDFISRAIADTIQRDEFTLKMGINPAAKK